MTVTKRTRFEVLRRDSHTCRYCGQSAPDVKLTIDHVVPSALGGSDDPSNLVAACKDCNAGKSSTNPDQGTVRQVEADAARWAAARARAVQRLEQDAEARKVQQAEFYEGWTSWDKDAHWLPSDWSQSVDRWISHGLTMEMILDAMHIAVMNDWVKARNLFRYMSGVLRNKMQELDDATRAELEGTDG